MKKVIGNCPRCGETTVGEKKINWGGRKDKSNSIFIGRPEKAGRIKCLSCQKVNGVIVKEFNN